MGIQKINIFACLIVILCYLNVFFNIIEAKTDKGFYHFQKGVEEKRIDTALFHLEKAVKYYESQQKWDTLAICFRSISRNLIRKQQQTTGYSTKICQKSVAFIHDAFRQLDTLQLNSKLPIANMYVDLALSYRRLEKNEESLAAYKKAFGIYKKLNHFDGIVAFFAKNVALQYINRLDYEQALYYLDLPLQHQYEGRHAYAIYNTLATCYFYLERYEAAWQAYETGLAFAHHKADSAKLKVIGAGILNKQKKWTKSLLLINYAMHFYESKQDTSYLINTYLTAADIFIAQKQLDTALYYYQQALALQPSKDVIKSRETARLHVYVGNVYQKKKNWYAALQHYQQALIQVFPNFNETDIWQNPPMEEVYPESWIMTATKYKANVLYILYKENGDINLLKNAVDNYQLSLQAVRKLRQSYNTENARLYLSDYNYENINNALATYYTIYQQTKEEIYLEQAFEFMEYAKANILVEAINKYKAFANVDSLLWKRENRWRTKIAELERQINLEKITNFTHKGEKLKKELAEANWAHEQFLDTVKNDAPKLKTLLESFNNPSVTYIKKNILQNRQDLLAYYWGEKYLYIIKINGTETGFYRLPIHEELQKNVLDFLALLKDRNPNLSKLVETGHRIYQQIYKPFVTLNTTQTLIIPDGILSFLPFGALLTDNQNKEFPRHFPYLIQKKQISYTYSATLLAQQRQETTTENTSIKKGHLLAVAPIFAQKMQGWSPLPYSKTEVEQIANTYPKTKLLLGQQADLQLFKSQAAQYSILHLSTHAGVDSAGLNPQIAFFDQSLYLPDLYALHLEADLVVLSACQTALGEIKKGEGVFSLARGFSYAGAKSLISTLWQVNDQSTAQILANFYTFLQESNVKPQALSNAQKTYINNCMGANCALPYYWAGLIYTENQLFTNDNKNQYWLIGFSLLSLLGLLYLSKIFANFFE